MDAPKPIDIKPLDYKTSFVDIIVPFHESYELLTKCVGGIINCTPNQDYRIILVDDASPNQLFMKNLTAHNNKIIGIRLDKQQGFGAALNAGFNVSSANHIVIMHSDTLPTNIYWLTHLQKSLANNKVKGIKLVTSRTNNVGTSCSTDLRLIGEPDDEFENDTEITDSPMPLFCCYCHRDLFKRIGGFIKPYPYAWCEDEELFWRMRYYGFKQAIATKSWVYHEGGATINKILEKDHRIKKIMENNQNLCAEDILPYLPMKQKQNLQKSFR